MKTEEQVQARLDQVRKKFEWYRDAGVLSPRNEPMMRKEIYILEWVLAMDMVKKPKKKKNNVFR